MSSPMPDYPSYLSRKYFTSLDIFRFLAIMSVVWHHTESGWAWLPGSHRGYLGVDFFFVISGFLIVTLLLRERDRTGQISLRGFYFRRTLRIFPIYYGMLAVLSVVFLLRPGGTSAKGFFEELPYQLTFLSNFLTNSTLLFFTWSLSSEEQFYIVWPPIERRFPRLAMPALVAILALNQALNFRLLGPTVAGWQAKLMILQVTFTPICLGVLLAHILHDRRGFDAVSRVLGRSWAPLVFLAATFLACNIPNELCPIQGDIQGWPRLVMQLAMTLLLASCVIREDHAIKRVFGSRWILRVGVISYGMYLYHMFVIHFVNAFLGRTSLPMPYPRFFLTAILTVAVAELSFRFYETPFLRLKDRWGQGARRREALVRAEVREDRPVQAEDVATAS